MSPTVILRRPGAKVSGQTQLTATSDHPGSWRQQGLFMQLSAICFATTSFWLQAGVKVPSKSTSLIVSPNRGRKEQPWRGQQRTGEASGRNGRVISFDLQGD